LLKPHDNDKQDIPIFEILLVKHQLKAQSSLDQRFRFIREWALMSGKMGQNLRGQMMNYSFDKNMVRTSLA